MRRLISLPARRVGALCTQRRGCPGHCWTLDAAPLLGYDISEKKPWRFGSVHTSALGGGGKLPSCRRAGTEVLLHLVCRGGLGWIFHLI